MRKGVDDLVDSATMYTGMNLLFHGYVLPFLALYSGWIYIWLTWWGLWEFYEGGMVGIAAIGCLQILVCLCCHWSVHIRCFITCRREADPKKATLVKVVPTANNGSTELLQLVHAKDGSICFMFQKTKYVWNEERKSFNGLEFPIARSMSEYLSWKGYGDDNELETAEQLYDLNRLDMVVPEFGELFKERATAPFFVFQV